MSWLQRAQVSLSVIPLSLLAAACSGAEQGSAERAAFDVLQKRIWNAGSEEKVRHLAEIEKELDGICTRTIASEETAASVAAQLRSFCDYGSGNSVLCPIAAGTGKWLVLYNISTSATGWAPVLTAFVHGEDGVRKLFSTRLWDEKATGLKSLMLPFERPAMIRDSAREGKEYLVLAGKGRVAAYFAVVNIDWESREAGVLATRFFERSRGALTEIEAIEGIKIEERKIVVVFPSESKVLHEGEGPLIKQATFVVHEGKLVEEKTEILNPWYMQVVLAIVSRRNDDREGFSKIVADAAAWELISKPDELMYLEQRRPAEHTAEVVLGMTVPTYRLVFQLEDAGGTWKVIKVVAEGKPPKTDDRPPDSTAQAVSPAPSPGRSSVPTAAASESEPDNPSWAMLAGAGIAGVLLGILIGRTRFKASRSDGKQG